MENTKHLPVVTSSPHVRSEDSVRSIMLDVLIALMPALLVSAFTFGPRALVLSAVSVGASVLFEYALSKVLKKRNPIGDLSAAVTGVILACNLPPSAPLWLPVVGAFFAVVIVKGLYGGLGKNVFNPALAARVFLFLSWSSLMSRWTAPGAALPLFAPVADAVSAATPLSALKEGVLPNVGLTALLTGQTGGCLGETSSLAILAGLAYLLVRRVITPRIPAAFLGTVALLTLLFPRGTEGALNFMAYELLGGGLLFGAVFMATDYTTSPTTAGGQWIYGAACGVITVVIRYFGAYSDGVSFAILLMNAFVFIIDRATRPRRYGIRRFEKLRARLAARGNSANSGEVAK